jgi:hypothetical protein
MAPTEEGRGGLAGSFDDSGGGTEPDADRWRRVRDLFHEVVDRDEEEWPALLAPLPEE